MLVTINGVCNDLTKALDFGNWWNGQVHDPATREKMEVVTFPDPDQNILPSGKGFRTYNKLLNGAPSEAALKLAEAISTKVGDGQPAIVVSHSLGMATAECAIDLAIRKKAEELIKKTPGISEEAAKKMATDLYAAKVQQHAAAPSKGCKAEVPTKVYVTMKEGAAGQNIFYVAEPGDETFKPELTGERFIADQVSLMVGQTHNPSAEVVPILTTGGTLTDNLNHDFKQEYRANVHAHVQRDINNKCNKMHKV